MSTKTTFKRIALVAVAALGFGVLSVVPSQANVSAVDVVTTNATVTQIQATDATTNTVNSDSTTAGSVTVTGLLDATDDTITVGMVLKSHPTGGATGAGLVRLIYADTTTATNTTLIGRTISAAGNASREESYTAGSDVFSISHSTTGYVGARFRIQADSATAGFPAGAYVFTIVVKAYSQGALATPVTTTKDVTITVNAKAAVVTVPAAANAKAFLAQGTGVSNTQLVDSVTAGSLAADGSTIGTVRVRNFDATDVAALDTITVSLTGPGVLSNGSSSGRSFIIAATTSADIAIKADGTSGEAKINITTAAGASFVKTVTFFDTKPSAVTAAVKKAFVKAGSTTEVTKVFALTVTDASKNPIVSGLTIAAAPTDTATTVGGAATCSAYDETDKVYYCGVKGLSATKFGPVAYTFTVTGADAAKTKVTTSATTTFADNVATKAVLAGPATGAPGATVEYTLTLTEKNGYPVADQTYGVTSAGGVLFSTAAGSTVALGWPTDGAPFTSSDSYTSVSGVITSEGTLPIAGTASLSLTLVGDGLQTLTTDAIDKTIGKTKVTVSTDVANPGVDAATDAANEATDAANAATDAALAAAEAADAATSAAQEASDAVAALSESVTKLIAGLQAQIKSLAAVVAKIAKKVKA